MGEIKKISFDDESPYIKERVRKYWSKRADGFMRLREAELESEKAERWTEEIISRLPKSTAQEHYKILDIGCGSGFFEVLLGRLGFNITGIDLTGEMVEAASELIEVYGIDRGRVRAEVMDAEKPRFPDESFDVIIMRNLTWTLPHPVEAYLEWHRILKPGGILLNYDAEYAKGAHRLKNPENTAHGDISDELKEECHNIYHMLAISSLDRPEWDYHVLKAAGFEHIEIDREVGDRIYGEKDEFYVPERMFGIIAYKPCQNTDKELDSVLDN